jgi:D-alanyl-D-alanine carboxypeptidase/D-alanyl-D-alanine-endopeptidase (penicillin-binding protein 4)
VGRGDKRRRRSATSVVVITVLSLVVLAALGYGGWVAYDTGIVDRLLGESEPTSPADVPPPTGVEVPSAPPPAAVLPTPTAPPPASRGLARALSDNLRQPEFGRHVGVLVEELGTGAELLRWGNGTFTPASTLKLLTTVAALDLLGPEHRFSTAVHRGAAPRDIVLVGGGDPLLARRPSQDRSTYPVPATTLQLARRTAATLDREGTKAVRLTYDASLFTGPAINPAWEPSYIPDGVVTPVSALWVDEGLDASGAGPRATDPARAAAEAFAGQLVAQGIEVAGPIGPSRTPAAGEEVASVESAPLRQIVDHTLLMSDNEAAEVLLRHVGIAAHQTGSSAAGVRGVVESLTDLGVDVSELRMLDGSGLARSDRLSLDTVVDTLQVAVDPANERLRAAAAGLPIAGFTGSLSYRFTAEIRPETAPGLGVVRAKTGTLTGVHGLAGTILDRDGAALVYVAIADRVRLVDTLDARAELDDLSAEIAACGCG